MQEGAGHAGAAASGAASKAGDAASDAASKAGDAASDAACQAKEKCSELAEQGSSAASSAAGKAADAAKSGAGRAAGAAAEAEAGAADRARSLLQQGGEGVEAAAERAGQAVREGARGLKVHCQSGVEASTGAVPRAAGQAACSHAPAQAPAFALIQAPTLPLNPSTICYPAAGRQVCGRGCGRRAQGGHGPGGARRPARARQRHAVGQGVGAGAQLSSGRTGTAATPPRAARVAPHLPPAHSCKAPTLVSPG